MTVANRGNRPQVVLVLCAWLVVAVPLGWGLYKSVLKSWPLFAQSAQNK